MATTDPRAGVDPELLDDVMRRAAFASPEEAVRLVRATLAVLGERLTVDESRALGARLGPELARLVEGSGYDGDFDAAELYERVRRREGASPGLAREHVHVVLRAVGARLDDGTRRRVVRALPDEIADLLVRAAQEHELPPHGVRHAPALHTLASGRPGSSMPVSEGRPPGAHTQSVVRSSEPHADTKLSSARGTTQERLGDTLAEGRPPAPARPVSEVHDQGDELRDRQR